MKLKLFTLLILSINLTFAQGWFPVGARSMSLGNASVALNDVWSVHHNPGALAELTSMQAGVSYENRFSLKELQYQAAAFALPLKNGAFGFGFQNSGFSLYRSMRVGFGYGMKLGENFSVGVNLNYMSVRIADYGQKGNVGADIGLMAKINEKTSVGFSVINLNRAKLVDFQDDRFSTFLRLGLRYNVSSKVLLLAEVEKEIQSSIRPKGAMEYKISDLFCLRLGVGGAPAYLTFGSGFTFKNGLKLDFGTAWNQTMGWSPHVGLNMNFNKKSDAK